VTKSDSVSVAAVSGPGILQITNDCQNDGSIQNSRKLNDTLFYFHVVLCSLEAVDRKVNRAHWKGSIS